MNWRKGTLILCIGSLVILSAVGVCLLSRGRASQTGEEAANGPADVVFIRADDSERGPAPSREEFFRFVFAPPVPGEGPDARFFLAAKSEYVDLLAAALKDPARSREFPKIMTALGYVGNAEAAKALISALEDWHTEEQPTGFSGLVSLPQMLGLCAHSNDEVYEYLKKGCFPQFWQDRIRWTVLGVPQERVKSALAGQCIIGLGLSGRETAREYLVRLQQQPREYWMQMQPAILEAVFLLDWAGSLGWEALRQDRFTAAMWKNHVSWAKAGRCGLWIDQYRERGGHEPE